MFFARTHCRRRGLWPNCLFENVVWGVEGERTLFRGIGIVHFAFSAKTLITRTASIRPKPGNCRMLQKEFITEVQLAFSEDFI